MLNSPILFTAESEPQSGGNQCEDGVFLRD